MRQGEGMPKTAEIRRRNRGSKQKKDGNPNRQEGEPARTVNTLGAAQRHLQFNTMPERMQYKARRAGGFIFNGQRNRKAGNPQPD